MPKKDVHVRTCRCITSMSCAKRILYRFPTKTKFQHNAVSCLRAVYSCTHARTYMTASAQTGICDLCKICRRSLKLCSAMLPVVSEIRKVYGHLQIYTSMTLVKCLSGYIKCLLAPKNASNLRTASSLSRDTKRGEHLRTCRLIQPMTRVKRGAGGSLTSHLTKFLHTASGDIEAQCAGTDLEMQNAC